MLINSVMPGWFNYIFMLTILSAGMSTVSSLFHVMGTSIGRDLYESCLMNGKNGGHPVLVTRIGIIFTVIVSVLLAYILPGGIIARATAVFFGVMASAFLPLLLLGIYSKRITKTAAIASSITGFSISVFWLVFVQIKEATTIGLCKILTGQPSLAGSFTDGVFKPSIIAFVDSIVIALPLSLLVLIIVSIFTKQISGELLKKTFNKV